MQAHESERQDLDRLTGLRDSMSFVGNEEVYLRAFPDAGGPPLEGDLFGAIREDVTR